MQQPQNEVFAKLYPGRTVLITLDGGEQRGFIVSRVTALNKGTINGLIIRDGPHDTKLLQGTEPFVYREAIPFDALGSPWSWRLPEVTDAGDSAEGTKSFGRTAS